jgi:hypothetical protein
MGRDRSSAFHARRRRVQSFRRGGPKLLYIEMWKTDSAVKTSSLNLFRGGVKVRVGLGKRPGGQGICKGYPFPLYMVGICLIRHLWNVP